jgi:hypothetical protein
MKYSAGLLVTVMLLWCWPTPAQIPGVSESHIKGHVPSSQDFRRLLLRDLRAYLQPDYGDKLTVKYELLRDVPTQSGVASPKFYLWLQATRGKKIVIAGVAKVAAIDKRQFEVLQFIASADIVANPQDLDRSFPAELVPKILAMLNLEE